ncbi:MAG TPA: thiamine pyrophosphate-dependent dehydrogenase E1 component subunit alpha [Candidatus Sulfotelmatobacter sp.]|nr:thiamine pyrophosphate-dependent dehydrogenase E1 component subunit alpha [Candidatus Sulfotelmatobacter sp.]
MLQTALETKPSQETKSVRDIHLSAFRFMLLARLLDDKLAALYRTGKIHGGVYLGRGQEGLSAAVGVSLQKGDVFAPLIRDAAGRLAFGETVLDSLRTFLGSAHGPMRGRDGNVHRGNPSEGLLPMISHLGAMISVVNGILLARRLQKKLGTVGAACIGDGATSTGSFHEAINQAAVEKLPLVLVIADNQYAYSTPTSRQFACDSLADRAIGYGVAVQTVDGTDFSACLKVLGEAVSRARRGSGPQLVVANFLRLCGHGEHDVPDYVDPELKNSPLGRDCLEVAQEFLLKKRWLDDSQLAAMKEEFHHEIETAVARVQREPAPDPFIEEWCAVASEHLNEGNIA